ncbi:peptidase T [Acholeplasma sp. OttesenSCG-928-E16]|nr:peptidase T [Acholeplasma sp. OttesenSCG-928-E16]
MKTINRFLNYVKIDTKSDHQSDTYPSTKKQFDLANLLAKELKEMGLEVVLDDYCYLYTKIPKNINKDILKVGFIAHLDTSPDASGKNVNPRIIENYDGMDIILNDKLSIKTSEFSFLSSLKGSDLVVTDGNTLLGADDKAGVAEIMSLVETLVTDSSIKHGDIYICFTPDEEIGRGTDKFNFDLFKADFAYTVDGGAVDIISYETFNAASALVTVTGKSIHPGSAKNKLVNASLLLMEFNNLLDHNKRPEYTEGYEGFNHLSEMKGEVERANANYIIRNHDKNEFEKQKNSFIKIKDYLNDKHGYLAFSVDIKDSYYNMYEVLKNHKNVIDLAENALIDVGLTPKFEAIRGGTDGARLSFEGLPCPNLGTGGYNFHGPFELLSINEMNAAVKVLLSIVKLLTNNN